MQSKKDTKLEGIDVAKREASRNSRHEMRAVTIDRFGGPETLSV